MNNKSYNQDFGQATFLFAATCRKRKGAPNARLESIGFSIDLDADFNFTPSKGKALLEALYPDMEIQRVDECCRATH